LNLLLRADGRLHRIDLESAEVYPLHATALAIDALGSLEASLTGGIDPTTMMPSPMRPRVEELLRLIDGTWVVAYRLSGLTGRHARLRFREIEPGQAIVVARANGHHVEDEPSGETEPPVGRLSLFSLVAGAATELVEAGKTPTPTLVARKLNITRTRLYKPENQRALALVKSLADAHEKAQQHAALNQWRGGGEARPSGGGHRVVRKSIEAELDDDR
jgi:hypothetical protein